MMPSPILPKPWGVVYGAPNPDGSRKNCKNCFMWIRDLDRCVIHDGDVEVTAQHVCGYHAYGSPLNSKIAKYVNAVAQDPYLTGLALAPEGTSCDICKRYDTVTTTCNRVIGKDGQYAKVEAKGCCARWVKGGE